MEAAALYLRQSVDHAEGIERQRERCRALAKARGWSVVAEFADNDVSASKVRGPGTGWGRMLAALERGEFRVVASVDLDRLLRSTRDLNTLIDLGAKAVTVDGEIDLTTADGEFRATMLAGIARFETRRRYERMVRAYQHRVNRGEQVGGWRPFGYEIGGDLVPAEAAAIEQGYRDVQIRVPLGAVARRWNEAGLTTTHGKGWDHGSVRKVLLNPRNAGLITYRGEVIHPVDESGSEVSATWTPIVTEETYRAVAAVLNDPARRSGVPSGRRLLSGIAICGVCGENSGSTVHAGGGNKPGRGTYRCKATTGHVARLAEPVESYISAVVVDRLTREDAADLMAAPLRLDTDALHSEALTARERLAALAVDYADGIITRDQMHAATERLRSRLHDIEGELADSAKVDVLGPLVGAEDVEAAWKGMPVERQRAVIDALMRVIVMPPGRGARTFNPESVVIEWKAA